MEFKGHPGKLGCWKLRKRLLSISNPWGAAPSCPNAGSLLQSSQLLSPGTHHWSSQSQPESPAPQWPSEQGLQHSPGICPLAKAQPSHKIFSPVTLTMTRTSKQWEGSEPTSSYLSKAIKLQGRHCRTPRVSLHILTVQARQFSQKHTCISDCTKK